MAAAWNNESDSNSESSSSDEEEEKVNLAFMVNIEDKFQEGFVESTSNSAEDVVKEPAINSGSKGKGVATKIPLLTRKAHRRSHKKKNLKVNMKPVIERLNAQGEILCYVQSDIFSIFISQSSGAKELAGVKAVLRGMRNELGSMKELVLNLSDLVRAQLSFPAPPAPTQAIPEVSGPLGPKNEEDVRPPEPSEEAVKPSGPNVVEETNQFEPAKEASGPPRPSVEKSGPPRPVEEESGPSGPVESEAEQVRVEAPVEAVVVPPEPPISSPLHNPAPSSPPSSSTAPPAPATFKQPLPKHISSPTPFHTTSSSPVSYSIIPPPPIFEAPPASSSSAGPSSSGPSSAKPSVPPPPTSHSTLHPPTPPSFTTLIPEGTRIPGVVIEDIKDEFEEKEIKLIIYFQMYNDYRYLNNLPKVQLGQFRGAIALLRTENPVNSSIQVDFATLKMPDIVFLPSLHSLVVDSAMGPIIFERYARVMGMIHIQKGNLLAFHNFLFREYHSGHIKSDVLSPSSGSAASKFQSISGQHASFGTSSSYKLSLGKDEYANFLEAQRQLHIQRMIIHKK
ncbi:hypothetical protein Taro_045820 [Colocasia esculenta]|uniref:Uncharacterized protein n=1 Tax=Colocasia esculenta TaxID=4460 RepID=A0A843X5C7_COLES|nr:hypothetical protein [Colocasia esculenta]